MFRRKVLIVLIFQLFATVPRHNHTNRGIGGVTTFETQKPVMLVIGRYNAWTGAGRDVPHMPGFHFLGFGDVTAQTLRRIAPDVVLCALMGDGFDAIDLAERLTALGFAGRLRALATDLPNPEAVCREVCAACPDIDFDVLVLNDGVLTP